MPFCKKIKNDSYVIGLWEINESIDELLNSFLFSSSENPEFQKIKIEKRKKEYLIARKIIEEITGEKREILYEKSGQPKLKDSNLNISISHSNELVAVILSKNKTGIDVENSQRDVDKIVHRYFHETENEYILKNKNPQFLKMLIWCAREAVFKCNCEKGIQFFSKQIKITPPLSDKEKIFYASLTTKSRSFEFELRYFLFKNNIVVYCVEEVNKKR